MQLTRKEVYKIIQDLKPNNFTYPNEHSVIKFIAEKMNVLESDVMKTKVKYLLKDFKRKRSSLQKRDSKERFEPEDDIVFDSDDYDSKEEKVVPEVKKIRKNFKNLGKKMQRERTEKVVKFLNNFLEEEDNSLTITELLGYLLYRVNYANNKNISMIGSDIFDGTINDKESFSIEESIAIMHQLVLSKEQMRTMQRIMLNKGIHFPNTNELNEARKKLRPLVTSVLDGKGVKVEYDELLKGTVKSIVSVVEKDGLVLDEGSEIKIFMKDGCDGAGQQVVWKSKSIYK